MRRSIFAAAAFAVVSLSSANAQGGKSTGAEAWKSVVGNTIVGKSAQGADLAEYYAPDGAVRQKLAGNPDKGKWELKGDKVCLKYESDDEDEPDCYGVAVSGDTLTYTEDDKSTRDYKIVKGNPNNL